ATVEARLGPDPLRPEADPGTGWQRVRRSRKPVAELLLDQRVLAGVGNVYRCEVLFRNRVDPYRPGRELRESTWWALWQDLVTLLPLGVAFGQILTMDDQVTHARAEIAAGGVATYTASLTGERLGEHFERRFFVYQRTGEPCRQCGSRVRSAPLAGRTLYWCGRCQRRR
ncbi:Fpg/Nei family DNA glycosylase, partial [Klebsiella pneumoniae]